MSACNCCEPFPLNVVTLQTRSESANVAKCGATSGNSIALNGELAFFLGGVFRRVVDTYTDPYGPSEQFPEGEEGWSGSATFTVTYDYDSENGCAETITFDPAVVGEGGIYENQPTFTQFVGSAPSNEHTDAQIKNEAQDLLVGEYGDWGTAWGPGSGGPSNPSSSARYQQVNLSFDADPEVYTLNDSYLETRLEARIAHPPTATGYLKVWLAKREYNYDPTSEIYDIWVPDKDSEFQEYTWTGEPASDEHSINSQENQIFGESFELIAPEGKRFDVFVLKWSLIPGYTPADPVLNEETQRYERDGNGELVRPDPDCESNGVPTLNGDCGFRP
jgi:hypothetical protein